MHDYPPGAARAFVLLGYIQNEDQLMHAKAREHWICRLQVQTHTSKGLGVYTSVSTANIAQHMLRKAAPAVVQLFQYVNLSVYKMICDEMK